MSFIFFSLCSCFFAFHSFILKLKCTNVKMWRHPLVLSAAAAAAAAWLRRRLHSCDRPSVWNCRVFLSAQLSSSWTGETVLTRPKEAAACGNCWARRAAAALLPPLHPTAGQTPPGGQNPNLKVRILNSEARNMILGTFLTWRYIWLTASAHYNRQIKQNLIFFIFFFRFLILLSNCM